jgi:hypothetical protein
LLIVFGLGPERAAESRKPPVPPVPPVRRAAATANNLGMKHYRAGELSAAAEQFRSAIRLDGSYVNAHYNLACVASRLGDVETALIELGWLDEPEDPQRWKKLTRAAGDADIDFVSAVPKVRELLGLSPFDERNVLDWLTERSGVWSAEADNDDCEVRTYSLRFERGGVVALTVQEQCRDQERIDATFSGKLTTSEPAGGGKASSAPASGGKPAGPATVTIDDWKAWPGPAPLTFSSCAGLEAPGSCFTLTSGKARMGPFHRGLPRPRRAPPAAGAATEPKPSPRSDVGEGRAPRPDL